MKTRRYLLIALGTLIFLLGACEQESEPFTDAVFTEVLSQVWGTVDHDGAIIDDADAPYDSTHVVPTHHYLDFEGEVRQAGHGCSWRPNRTISHYCTFYLIYEGTARHHARDTHEDVFAVMIIEVSAEMTETGLAYRSVKYRLPRVITEDFLLYVKTKPPVTTLEDAQALAFTIAA